MASTPQWKVYRGGKNGEYIAATKYAEDAAVLVAMTTDGVVKYDHKQVVWTEGAEEFKAGESYDRAVALMIERRNAENAAAKARHEARFAQSFRDIQESAKNTSIPVPPKFKGEA